jgi:SAM-dependent methyltransferase
MDYQPARTMRFKDHFSGHSGLYSQYRPDYPDALFRFLAESSPSQTRAWDCATGSGQAALGLSVYFEQVLATDASSAQLEKATPEKNIEYNVAQAEKSGLETGSIDLVTVAQALHWFDIDAFYHEAERVLRPGGVLAVWNYNMLQCDASIDALLEHLYSDIVGPWWPPERALIENDYNDLAFPFEEQPAPDFAMHTEWDLEQMLGYLRTWSAVQRYARDKGLDPVTLIEEKLSSLWGPADHKRPIHWPLSLRWGRKP